MVGLGLLLALLAAVAGVAAYLMTGNVIFLGIASVGLVTVVSGYVLSLGRRRSR